MTLAWTGLVVDCVDPVPVARFRDVGQTGAETWVVLADPDGNEFCVLRGGG